jgi:tetratricopeptide (TPR) repeat protein
MSEKTIDETQPVVPAPQQEPEKPSDGTHKKGKTWLWIAGGILVILLIGAAGGAGGYYAGIADRQAVEKNEKTLAASTQFQLGLADLAANRFEMAKQRFEYVIQLDPSYPGVLESMAKLTIIMNATATPTAAPIPTAAPTLDLSGVEALLAQSKQLLAASDWNGAISALDNLRKQNASFKTLEIDGMYYLALRGRGIQKIANGSLEGGIYDFANLRLFGPEDNDMQSLEEAAKQYINAGRYFGWDWANAVKYFGDLYKINPQLMDSSHDTVADRYRRSLAGYADQLSAKQKWCDAVPYYQESLAIANDNKIAAAYNKANNKCIASQPTEAPTIDPNAPTAEVPTEAGPTAASPTAVPTEAPTAVPPPPTAEPTVATP